MVSDEALMAQVIDGNRGSLELLVRRHADALLTFLCRNLRNWHKGEELFQEVFLAVWSKRHQFDAKRPFKPWLYAIAVNKVREMPVIVDGELEARKLMNLLLSCDHRVVDGWDAASFMQTMKGYIENPIRLLSAG